MQADHKPLESIFKKPLNSTPKRLQRMMLRLQKYQLTVKYHRGETLKLADMLSRAFLPEVNTTDFTEELASIDHRATLTVSEARWMQVNKESADDAVMSELKTRRFSLPSLHILHVRCQFCVIRAVRKNLQFLPV